MYIANLVKESGSNQGKCTLLLETEKICNLKWLSVIAESENCTCFHMGTHFEGISKQEGDVSRQWDRVDIFTMRLQEANSHDG